MNYPTWFPDGTALATEDDNGSPSPNTTTIDASTGAIIATALEGKSYWGGMPSVESGQSEPHRLRGTGGLRLNL